MCLCMVESDAKRLDTTKAFTVIELLIGMVITSIILSAVATFAFALSVGCTASGDTAVTQAQVRQATLRLSDLVGGCRLLCAAPGNDLVVWRADDNADNRINLNELVYIERGDNCSSLRLCQFASVRQPPGQPQRSMALGTTKTQFQTQGNPVYVPLIPQGKNVQFAFYPAVHGDASDVPDGLVYADGKRQRSPYQMVVALRGERRTCSLRPATPWSRRMTIRDAEVSQPWTFGLIHPPESSTAGA